MYIDNKLISLEEFHAHFPIHADKDENSKEFKNYQQVMVQAKERKQRIVRVICGHCGVGKSRRLFKEWEQLPDKKKIYFSHSHLFLNEQAQRLDDSRHIQGLRKKCHYKNSKDIIISELIQQQVPNKIVCGICKHLELKYSDITKCEYKKQFIKMPNNLFMPIEYGFTDYLEIFKPDLIAVDDCLTRKMNHLSLKEIEQFFKHLNKFNEEIFEVESYQQFGSFAEFISNEEFDNLIENYIDYWNDLLAEYIKINEKEVKFQQMPYGKYNPEEFRTYKKYADIYGMLKQFATSFLFPIFDYIFKYTDMDADVDEVPHLVLVEAQPNEKFLQAIVDMYFRETGNVIHLDFEYIEPENIPESEFYRCYTYKDSWYPTTASIKKNESTRAKIKESIQDILNTYYDGADGYEIGLIFPKGCKVQDFIDIERYTNVKFLTYGNLRGKNEMENCNPLFVIGTYLIDKTEEKLEEEYFLWFKEYPEDLGSYQEEHQKSRWRYNNSDLDNFRKLFEDEEQYHAVFRSRALTFPREVFCFGIIPEEVKEIFGEVINIKFERKVDDLDGERMEFLANILEQHKGQIKDKDVRKICVDKWNIQSDTARKIINRLVEENDEIEFIRIKNGRSNPKYVSYKK